MSWWQLYLVIWAGVTAGVTTAMVLVSVMALGHTRRQKQQVVSDVRAGLEEVKAKARAAAARTGNTGGRDGTPQGSG